VATPRSFQGPHILCGLLSFMYFVYLDEFGHIGPFISRKSNKHNESPVFGLAGMILPENSIRPFATFFLKQKEFSFAREIQDAGKKASKWEKKGTSFIRPKPMKEYADARRLLHRVMKKIDDLGGHLFYYGREKRRGLSDDLNSVGLYTTCFAHCLQKLNTYCDARDSSFVVVMDQHSARKELLECASKTMFGNKPCRRLASPPFEVESYLNQNIQAADWIATLVGRLMAYQCCPDQYPDYLHMKDVFGKRLNDLKANSILEKRPRRETRPPLNGPFSGLAELRAKL